jgi:hypothetical protein
MGKPGMYLRDRLTGDLYGWNYEMAKLPYMKEVSESDDDFSADNTGPDPTYVAPPEGFPVSSDELEKDRKVTEEAALAKAAAAGAKELDEPVDNTDLPPPEYDSEGHKLLGYDADDNPVYETDEERDERLSEEGEAEEPLEEETQVEAPAPKTAKRKK